MNIRVIILLIVLFFLPKNIFAHPGNTASDGCHYCRTNCDSWGVEWNERHCHNGTPIRKSSYSTQQQTDSNFIADHPLISLALAGGGGYSIYKIFKNKS